MKRFFFFKGKRRRRVSEMSENTPFRRLYFGHGWVANHVVRDPPPLPPGGGGGKPHIVFITIKQSYLIQGTSPQNIFVKIINAM